MLKVKFVTDTMNVSGGFRLRSVPARQAAHVDSERGDESEAERIMFAVKKVITTKTGQHHRVREGKCVVALM